MNTHADSRCRIHTGFTLIELLTVVAIIGILAAIMIPVVGKVRKSAMNVRCISNLRGLGGALAVFTVENNNKLPPRNLEKDIPYTDANPSKSLRFWTSRLYRHGILKDRNAFYCPAVFPTRDSEVPDSEKIEETGGLTYGMRMWMRPGGKWGTDRHLDTPLTAIENPSDFFLIADSIWLDKSNTNGRPTQGYGINPTPNSTANQRIHRRHSNRANTLFADFHVAAKDDAYFTKHIPETQAAYMNTDCYFTTLGENETFE
ncbi:prepilin-type N-terminal cleavage/methylation domain-containing protein [Opitutaceae bacterium TAV4]|nr:prepilin-type N-terminal cleavage/methylation domain-containing protein [Opitutaceae bacterium TAV4]RRK02858.1 prepilin-type N-terminal cleavage/methylation domain-containing protein [Opitutaceae bacterium TAV3]